MLLACTGYLSDTLSAGMLQKEHTIRLKEKNYLLQEVSVNAIQPEQLIKQVSRQLNQKIKFNPNHCPYNFYGNGQYLKIVESKGKTIQLDREYGLYLSSDNCKRHEIWDLDYRISFFPVYAAYSFRLNSVRKDTLKQTYLSGSSKRDLNFNANQKNIYIAMRAVYLYGPLFAPAKYFNYKLVGNSNNLYTFEFSTKTEYYPQKIKAFCRGKLQIDKTTLQLKHMQFDHFIYHLYRLPFKWQKCFLSPYTTQMEMDFDSNEAPCYIQQCSMKTTWINKRNKQNVSIETPPRPYASEQQIVEKEVWKVESHHIFPLGGEIESLAFQATTRIKGSYNASLFQKLPPLLDISKAIQDLNEYFSLEKQYQSSGLRKIYEDYPDSTIDKNFTHTYQLIKKLFKEPDTL